MFVYWRRWNRTFEIVNIGRLICVCVINKPLCCSESYDITWPRRGAGLDNEPVAMDPLQFKITSLSPVSAVQSQDSSDEASDERTSFIRSAKAQRKYGSTTSSRMNSSSPIKYYQGPQQNPMAFMHHKVQPSDTLMGIALRYHTTVNILACVKYLPF